MNEGDRRSGAGVALLLAGAVLAGSGSAVMAQSAFSTLDRTARARIEFAAAERGVPILAGGKASVSGEGFRPGQQVVLHHGATPLPGGTLAADAEGRIAGEIAIPADAVAGTHPIVVVAQAPYSATVASLKVSPAVPLSGQSGYRLTQAQAARGLYQSAYSGKDNTLFVTSAVGRPPVRQSELVKLDADTLEVLARVTPQPAPVPVPVPARQPGAGDGEGGGASGGASGGGGGPGLFAVYGIGLDDARDTVWVSNTRQDTVAVYRQSDLALVRQFAPGTVTHPRDVRVDAALGKVYVSATGKPEVAVFDAVRHERAGTVTMPAPRRGGEAFSAASLSLDERAHRLYVVSLSSAEVAVIDTRTDTVIRTLPVPGARGAIGVSHDPQTGRIYVAAQGSDNLVVLDGDTGAVVADTPVGAGALNVVFDPVRRRAYVSNRGAGTITVTDADGKIVANLGPAPSANHVALGKDGTVFAVDKSAGARDAENDTVTRIHPRT